MGAKSNQMPVKSPSNTLWKPRNAGYKREEDKTQKFVNDKEDKMKKLTDKNLEL